MTRTIIILSCVALLAGAAISQAATDEAVKAAGGMASTQPASAPATGPASRPASGPAGVAWTTLFADQKWYKDQASKDEVLTGGLQAMPDAGAPTTLMRTTYYKFGDWTIYSAGRKVKALDDLIGRRVEIRGKRVTMELEGKAITEIWPAAVRSLESGPDSLRW